MTVRRGWKILAVVSALCIVEWFWPFVWVALPITGQVIDKDTRKPVPNALVAVVWQLSGGPIQVNPVGVIRAEEVETDVHGRFRTSIWGPRFSFGWGSVLSDQPALFVTHEAYDPVSHIKPYRMDRGSVWFVLPYEHVSMELERTASRQRFESRTQEVYSDLIVHGLISARLCRRAAVARTLRRLVKMDYGKPIAQQAGEDSVAENWLRSLQTCNPFVAVFGGAG
jgi:hypothetical protein